MLAEAALPFGSLVGFMFSPKGRFAGASDAGQGNYSARGCGERGARDSRRIRAMIDLRDEAGAAAAGHINPQPTQGDCQTIPQTDQKVNMRKAPHPPGEPAVQLHPAEIDDRRPLADGGEAAGMAVSKWPAARVTGQATDDGARRMDSLLLCRRGDAGRG